MNACYNCGREYQGELPDICEEGCNKHTTPRFTESLAEYLQGLGLPVELAKVGEGIRIIMPVDPQTAYEYLKEMKPLSVEPSTNG